MDVKGYKQDVDLKGQPVLAAQTRKWKACVYLVGNIICCLLISVNEFIKARREVSYQTAPYKFSCLDPKMQYVALKILRASIILNSLSIKSTVASYIPIERTNYDFLFIRNFIEFVLMQYGTISYQ